MDFDLPIAFILEGEEETMTTIAFVRHGNTDWNNEQRAQGHSDNSLNETGRTQAKAVAQRLSKGNWDLLITSDLRRTRETAKIISSEIGIPIAFLDKRLREINRGQTQGTIEEERVERWGSEWGDLDLGVESKQSVRKRGMDFVEDIIEGYPNKKILIVSHGVLIGQTLKGLLLDETTGNNLENTSVTVLRQNENDWEYACYNCVRHLKKQTLSNGSVP